MWYTGSMSDPLAPVAYTLLDDLDVTVPELNDILTDIKPPLEAVRKADMLIFNFNLAVLHGLWDKVETLPAAFAMIDKQMLLIEKRRSILGLDYGPPKNTGPKGITWEPLP